MGSGASANQTKATTFLHEQQVSTKSQCNQKSETGNIHLQYLRLAEKDEVQPLRRREMDLARSKSESTFLKDVRKHRHGRSIRSEGTTPPAAASSPCHWVSALQAALLEAKDMPKGSLIREKHLNASKPDSSLKDAKQHRHWRSIRSEGTTWASALRDSLLEAMDAPEMREKHVNASRSESAFKDAKQHRYQEIDFLIRRSERTSKYRHPMSTATGESLSESMNALNDKANQTAKLFRRRGTRDKLQPLTSQLRATLLRKHANDTRDRGSVEQDSDSSMS